MVTRRFEGKQSLRKVGKRSLSDEALYLGLSPEHLHENLKALYLRLSPQHLHGNLRRCI